MEGDIVNNKLVAAPVEPSPKVIVGFVMVFVLVGIYIASALISNKHRTPYA
ncbi:hypothetical protein ACFLUA_00985 [Chloroflexota bacterium]